MKQFMIKIMEKGKKCYSNLFKKCLTPTKVKKTNDKKKAPVKKKSTTRKSN